MPNDTANASEDDIPEFDGDDDPSLQAAMEAEKQRKLVVFARAMSMLDSLGFDSVVIAGTYIREDGTTAVMHRCRGNWYAVNGTMRHLLDRREHNARIEAEQDARLDED